MATRMFRTCRSNRLIEFPRNIAVTTRRSEHSVATISTDDSDAHYPPVKPKYPPGKWGEMSPKTAWKWQDELQNISSLKTKSQKIDYITNEERFSWKFPDVQFQPKKLQYVEDKTKTMRIDYLHEGISNMDVVWPENLRKVNVTEIRESVKPYLMKTIEQEIAAVREIHEKKQMMKAKYVMLKQNPSFDNRLAKYRVKSLLLNLFGLLSDKCDHLQNLSFDEDVSVSTCWSRDSVGPKIVSDIPSQETLLDNKPFKAMMYGDCPVSFMIRQEKPPPEFIERDSDLCTQSTYSQMTYRPSVLGQFKEKQKWKINPGFQQGDPYQFTHLSFQLPYHNALERVRGRFGFEHYEQALEGYALTTSFLTTVAQAHFQGFNMFEELTYPFTTQTIVTDGRLFYFTAYQLNTMHMWKSDNANEYQNIFWVNKPCELYTEEDGKVKQINDHTLDLLLKSLLLAPCDRGGINLHPNLSAEDTDIYKDSYIKHKKDVTVYEEEILFDRN